MTLRLSSKQGFTLIEMIVSLGVFSTIVTISIGALLVLVATNDQLQGEQSVMTNLSFALDSMTREIRTGTNYYCASAANYQAFGQNNIFTDIDLNEELGDDTNDCEGRTSESSQLHGLAFIEGGRSITGTDESRILYFHDQAAGQLFRRIGSEQPVSIVSSDIVIEDARFTVTGSESLRSNASERDQAVVTLVIRAHAANNPDKSYVLQTSITQRTLDI